jgi:hypothetical protein
MARLRHRSLHLGVSRGRPWCPPSLLRQSSAFEKERPLTRPMYLSGLRPLHLCGTRLEGGHQGLSRRYGWVEGEPLRGVVVAPGHCRSPGSMWRRWLAPGCRTPSSRLCLRAGRRCCRALWLGPREPQGSGESSVPTLEASSAQVSGRRPHKTWAAQRSSEPSAEDCLSSEGGHRTLCAATSRSAPLRPRPQRRPRNSAMNQKKPAFRRVSYQLS